MTRSKDAQLGMLCGGHLVRDVSASELCQPGSCRIFPPSSASKSFSRTPPPAGLTRVGPRGPPKAGGKLDEESARRFSSVVARELGPYTMMASDVIAVWVRSRGGQSLAMSTDIYRHPGTWPPLDYKTPELLENPGPITKNKVKPPRTR